MSVRLIPLFDGRGCCTPFLAAQWRKRGAGRALPSQAVLIDASGAPTGVFTGIWAAAFPSRPALPEKVAEAGGVGTQAFWFVFA